MKPIKHDETDDFFLVLKGRLTIRMREGNVTLGPGEIFVVPNTGDRGTAAPRRIV
jgi:mannose-6-phosphate isomerase-like protein (cupin superfamily)